MKKLMTMLAAVGMAFGLFAADPDPIVDTNDFASVTQEAFSNDTQWTYNGTATKPIDKVWVANNLLNLATGSDKVSRTFVPGSAATVTDAIYFDANINFEDPFDEAPVVTDANAKIAAFVLDNSGIIEELGSDAAVAASTNLYVIAGYYNSETTEWEKRAFMFATPAAEGIASKTEKRLTIKAYGDVMAGADTRMGFRFFLNGNTAIKDALAVRYVFPIKDDGSIDFTTFIDADNKNTPYLGAGVKDSLEAAVRSRCSDQTLVLGLTEFAGSLTGFDLAGKGELAKFTLTTTSPEFIGPDAKTMKIEADEGVDEIIVQGAEYDSASGVITYALGTTSISVSATYNEGFTNIVEWTYLTKDVTPDPITDPVQIEPSENAVLTIHAAKAEAFVEVNGVVTPYKTINAAITAVKSSGGTLKLATDAELSAAEGKFQQNKEIVIDLAGNDITSKQSANPTIRVTGGQLTIIDTVSGGTIADSGAGAIENNAKLIIAGGIINGAIATVGYGEDVVATIISNGTFNAAVTLDNTEATTPATLTTVGGNFVKGAVFGTEEPSIPGVQEGYDVVDSEVSGYWKVVEVTGYTITVAVGIQNGTVEVDKEKATAGETVTITATPDPGYKLGTITTNDAAIVGTTFVMPEDNVVVSATFVEKDYVAQIVGGDSFETFAEAVAAVADGQTIKLIKDCSAAMSDDLLIKADNVTLDLNECTLTHAEVAGDLTFGVASGKTLTVTNGTISMTSGANGFAIGTNATAYIYCKMEKLSINNPVLDIYGGKVYCNELTDLSGTADIFRFKEPGLSSEVYVSGGNYKTTATGKTSSIFHHYKDNHNAKIVITGGEFDFGSYLIDAYKKDAVGPTVNFTKLDASNAARFTKDVLVSDQTGSVITEADVLAADCKVIADTEKTGWYKVAAIEYATLTVDADAGVKSYVLSNATEEISLPYRADKDLAEVITAYVTEFNDGKVLDSEKSELSVTLIANAEIKIVTKASAQPVNPGEDIKTDKTPAQINDSLELKKQLLTAPDGATVGDGYYGYFDAVNGSESGTVKFVLNATGSNTVATAEAAANADALEAVLAATTGSKTLEIETPVAGFYYSLKQSGVVTTLDFNDPSDANKLATGKNTITFALVKPENAGFYQTIVTPVPVNVSNGADD